MSFFLSIASSAVKDPRNLSLPPTDGFSASPRTQILTGDRGSHCEVLLLPAVDFLLLLRLSSGRESTVFVSSLSSPPSPFCRFLPFLPLPAAATPANSTAVSTAGFRSSSPTSQPSLPRQVVHYPSLGSSSPCSSTFLNSGREL